MNLVGRGNAAVMSLHCDGYTKHSSQTDCRTYFDNGTLTFANRYSIREWSHTNIDQNFLFDNNKTFNAFVKEVSAKPSKYNNINGTINAVPILSYHRIDNNRTVASTDVDEFAKEMKYLDDNGFTVLPISSLKYNETANYFYLNYNNGDGNNKKGLITAVKVIITIPMILLA